MIRIHEAIVVEGRYDRNTLRQIIDAPIFETSGFGIFKNKEQMAVLRRVAETRGLIVFTDADGAGLVIRNHLKSVIPAQYLKHAYTPDVFGKERRKIIEQTSILLQLPDKMFSITLLLYLRIEETVKQFTAGIQKLYRFWFNSSVVCGIIALSRR